MTAGQVRTERRGPAAWVTVDRAEALNVLAAETLDELGRAVEGATAAGARVLVLTGAGDKAFVAGADVAAMAPLGAGEARAFARRGQELCARLEALPVPVIAAVNGYALGGGLELALACDLIVASTRARFGQPEINLGIIPGFGGTQRLARRVGVGRARELIYLGDMVDADAALAMGLVDRVVEPAALGAECQQLAERLAAKPAVALREAKAAINAGLGLGLDAGCRYEAEAFAVAFASEDRREGMDAFLHKRTPAFRGR